jgi:hypothetical protein
MRLLLAGAAAYWFLIRWTCGRLAEVSGTLRAPDPGMGSHRTSVVDRSCLLSKHPVYPRSVLPAPLQSQGRRHKEPAEGGPSLPS